MTDQQRPTWAIRLHDERTRRGWGPFETARQLREAVGITRHPTAEVKNLAKQVTRHERGHIRPRDWATAYATIYDVPADELFPPPPPRPVADNAGTVVQNITPDHGDENDVKRRAALQLLTALSAGTAVPPGALETVLSGIEDALGNPLDLGEWERAVHGYGHLIYRRPVGALAEQLTADIIAVGQLLKRPYSDGDKAGLYRVSAGLSGLLAIDLGDMGDTRAARVAWGTARRAADISGDHDLSTWVRATQVRTAYWEGASPTTVGELLADLKGGGPSTIGRAVAVQTRARLLADKGDVAGAANALDELRSVFEALPDSVTTDHLSPWGWTEDLLRLTEGHVYATLGEIKQGVLAIDRALALYPPEREGSRANLRLMRAICLVQDGEINEGLREALTTVEAAPPSSASRRRITGQILQALPYQARTLPAARDLEALITVA